MCSASTMIVVYLGFLYVAIELYAVNISSMDHMCIGGVGPVLMVELGSLCFSGLASYVFIYSFHYKFEFLFCFRWDHDDEVLIYT